MTQVKILKDFAQYRKDSVVDQPNEKLVDRWIESGRASVVSVAPESQLVESTDDHPGIATGDGISGEVELHPSPADLGDILPEIEAGSAYEPESLAGNAPDTDATDGDTDEDEET